MYVIRQADLQGKPGIPVVVEEFNQLITKLEEWRGIDECNFERLEQISNTAGNKVRDSFRLISYSLKVKLMLAAFKFTKNPGVLVDHLFMDCNIPFPCCQKQNLTYFPGTITRLNRHICFVGDFESISDIFKASSPPILDYLFGIYSSKDPEWRLEYVTDDECLLALKNLFSECESGSFEIFAKYPCFQQPLMKVLDAKAPFEILEDAIRESKNRNQGFIKMPMPFRMTNSFKLKSQKALVRKCFNDLLNDDLSLAAMCHTKNMRLFLKVLIRQSFIRGDLANLLRKLRIGSRTLRINDDFCLISLILRYVEDEQMLEVLEQTFPKVEEIDAKQLCPPWSIKLKCRNVIDVPPFGSYSPPNSPTLYYHEIRRYRTAFRF